MYRILYYYPYSHSHTGSPRMLINMIKTLDRNVFEPVFLSVESGPLEDEMRALNVDIVRGDVGTCSLKSPINLAKRAIAASRRLKEWRIDLAHLNELPWNLDLGFGLWLRRIPTILHTHNKTEVTRKNLMFATSDKILFVSENQRKNAKNINIIMAKTEILYNFISFDYYASGRNIRQELGLSRDDFVVATISQICEHKGIDTLIETARRCLESAESMKFLVVGGDAAGEADFAAEMRERVDHLGLSDDIIFLGARTDIPDILASMDILFHPSRREAFGLVIVEAMAAGKPVVTSGVGGIEEIISTVGEGVVINEQEPKSYAAALLEFRKMPDRGKALGQHGRKNAFRHFSREANGAKLAQIYDGLLSTTKH